jgi:hypothetical protein
MPSVNVNDVVSVPTGGLPAWSEPDPALQPLTRLPEGLSVTVVERRGDWARVSGAGGATGWVDAGRLVPTAAAASPRDTRLRERIPLRAVELAVLVVVVGLAFLFVHDAPAGAGDVVLEPAGSVSPGASATTVPPPSQGGLVRASAAAPGIYAGVRDTADCDAAALSADLARDAARAEQWAKAAGIAPAAIPRFLTGLTPATLRLDTRLTEYQLQPEKAVPKQAVLQAGTAVLLDRTAMPRVRCASGVPLAQPRAVTASLDYTGRRWALFSPETIVVLDPAPRTSVLVLIDARDGSAFGRILGSAAVIDIDQPAEGAHVVVIEPGRAFAISGTADVTVTWDDPATELPVSATNGRVLVKSPATATPGAHAVTVTKGGVATVKQIYVIPAA